MIKALQTGPGGRHTVVAGLTDTNLELLAGGQPIRFNTTELDLRPGLDVLILAGDSTTTLATALRAWVHVPTGADATGGILAFYTGAWPGATATGTAVIAITPPVTDALREGAEVWFTLGADRPGLRLLAAADIDTLAARITAGVPARRVVDRRTHR